MARSLLPPPSLRPSAVPRQRERARWAPSRGLCAGLIVLAVVLGAACRLRQYLACFSYWRDEAFLLLNIMDKSAAQLLGPLDHFQSAPPLFLLIQRALYVHFGSPEWLMRLLPLTCGLLALGFFAWLAWKLLQPGPAVWAAASFALCDELMFHAVSMKQYSGDALITVCLLLLALWVRRSSRPGRAFMVLAIVTVATMGLSLTALFVFAGISLVLAPLPPWLVPAFPRAHGQQLGEANPARRVGTAAWLAANALVGAAGLALYLRVLRPQHDPFLFAFWADALADYQHPWLIPWFVLRESYRLCEVPCRATGPILCALILIGGWHLWRRGHRQTLALLLAPVLMTILAACLRQYPYHGGRVTVFLLPCVMLLGGFGLQALRVEGRGQWPGQWRGRAQRLWWLPALPALLIGVYEAAGHALTPQGRSDIGPAVAYLKAHRQPGDAIYLVGEGRDPDHPLISGDNLEFYCYWRTPEPPVFDAMPPDATAIPPGRFWVAFTFLPRHGGTKYLDPLLAHLGQVAQEKDRFVVKSGGGAVLFEKP